jgi:hypothetical protein
MKTPVLFLIFNRPDKSLEVFNAIRKARPEKLFVGADGPRPHKPDDVHLCQETRDLIKKVDWPCEVKTLFREKNLGCRKALSEAITWFFENVESGIILEDDCVPHQPFFKFCEEMLEKYKNDERMAMVSGSNDLEEFGENYLLTKYGNISGWATWKRAWNLYDKNFDNWTPEIRDQVSKWTGKKSMKELSYKFDEVKNGRVKSWGYIWLFTKLFHKQYTIAPSRNLVKNIGFDFSATHTRFNRKPGKRKAFEEFNFKILDEKDLKWNKEYDEIYVKENISNITIKIKRYVKTILNMPK